MTRHGDWNSYNRQLLEETRARGGNQYRIKYLEATKQRMYLSQYDPEDKDYRNRFERFIDMILNKICVFIGTHCECGLRIDPDQKKCVCGRRNGY